MAAASHHQRAARCRTAVASSSSCSSSSSFLAPRWPLSARQRHISSSNSRLKAAAVDGQEAPRPRGRPRKNVDGVEAQRKLTEAAPVIYERGAPELPSPAVHQQTLRVGFMLSGIGLHSGEFTCIRVRPAFAGEGRYFVRVEDGTNSSLYKPDPMEELPSTNPKPPNMEIEAQKIEVQKLYIKAQHDEGFGGTMEDFIQSIDMDEMAQRLSDGENPHDDWIFDENDNITERSEDEYYVKANIDNIFGPQAVSTFVGDVGPLPTAPTEYGEGEDENEVSEGEEGEAADEGEAKEGETGPVLYRTPFFVASVELLLSALEACGVDNCRIEMEGGTEIPILDGSALQWTLEIQYAGLRPAPLSPTMIALAEEEGVEDAFPLARTVMYPKKMVTVRNDDNAFITLYPENTMRLTVGIDHTEDAEIIGSQWLTWNPLEELHYRFELAGARTFAVAPEQCIALRDFGLLKGGTEGCMLIGFGNRWWDPAMVRYIMDEPVRHTMVDLIGDLSLNANDGSSGLPLGHIVAYKPTNELVMQFIRALREACEPEDYVFFNEVMESDILGEVEAAAAEVDAKIEERMAEDAFAGTRVSEVAGELREDFRELADEWEERPEGQEGEWVGGEGEEGEWVGEEGEEGEEGEQGEFEEHP